MAHPFINCLADAVEAKALTKTQFKKAQARFENLADEYAETMDPLEAANRAAGEATEQFAIENREMKRRKLLAMVANIRLWRDMQKYVGDNKHQAWRGFFDTDDAAPFANQAALKDAYHGMIMEKMNAVVQQFKNRWAGVVRPTKDMEEMLFEVSGRDTGNANAKVLADAWKDAQKTASRLFHLVGGSVRELPDWRLPQSQDYLKLHRAGSDEWVADHLDWMDWDKVRRSDGSRLITPEERKKFLEEAFKTLHTDGANKLDLANPKMATNFSNKLANHRVLHYNGPEAWLAMHKKYGSGSIFDVMLQHTQDMAHEIAMIERFGPSPTVALANIEQMISKLAPTPGHAQKEIKALRANAAIMLRQTGLARTDKIGVALAGTRNMLQASLLGSAALIAVPSDLNLMVMAKHFNRLDDMKFMRQYLKLMNPLSSKDRALAVRLGFVADTVSAQMYGARRFMGEAMLDGPSWTRRIADVSLNLSALTPHTQSARWAFGMEMLGLFADNRTKAFDDLPFADMLRRHGITANEWDLFRQVDVFEPDTHPGATFLRPDDILDHYGGTRTAQALMAKIKSAVIDESRVAVPDMNNRSRAWLVGESNPSTWPGEIARSVAMFKNFPVTFLNVIARRYLMTALNERGGRSAAMWTAYLMTSMTALGALRIQMSNISQGHDTQDMTNGQFMLRSMMIGGGFGLLGDFVLGDYNRLGGGPIASIGGPVAQFGDDLMKVTWGNVREVTEGKDTKALTELVEFGQRYAPGSRLWWSRLMVDRLFWDQLVKLTDPDAEARFDRKAKRQEKLYGRKGYWERGDLAPRRAPDVSNTFGGG